MSKADAFFISGHGDQDAGTFIVPEGRYVVVKSETCMLASAYTFHDDFDNLLKMDMDEILHPNKNDTRIKIRDAFGTACTIYGPGMQCPNFRYYLCNVHVYEEYILVDLYVGSGVIDLRAVKQYRELHGRRTTQDFYIIRKNDKIRPIEELITEISQFYSFCVYPLKQDIINYLSEKWKGVDNVTQYDMVKDLHNTTDADFKAKIRVTQEQLCKASNGIFYHNVCRALSSKLQHYGKQLNLFKTSNESCPSVRNMFRNPVYRELIKESLVRRRNEKKYQNSNYPKNKLYQSALQNASNLQERIKIIEKAKNDVHRGTYSNNEKNKLIQEINKETRSNILSRALSNALRRCKKYNVSSTRSRSRSRNSNPNREGDRNRSRSRNSNPNREGDRNRSRSPHRGGKNKTHRKRR